MEGILPSEVLWRKKSPYPKTHDPKYMELVSTELRKLLDTSDAPLFQIVNKKQLWKLLDGAFESPWYGQLMQVPQTIAYMLQMNLWLTKYHIDILA